MDCSESSDQLWEFVVGALQDTTCKRFYFIGNSLCVVVDGHGTLALHLSGRGVWLSSGEPVQQPSWINNLIEKVYLEVRGRTPYFRATRCVIDKRQIATYSRKATFG